jgi:neurofibromin 1
VRERFPEAKYTAVGGFIFLRFFCPAIVSPEAEGLVKLSHPQPREFRRGQLIVTKVIQNLANNVLFGAKETYMIILNDFLTSNIYKVTNFLREMSNLPPGPSPVQNEEPTTQMEEKDYAKLHRYLFDNLERMTRDLAARKPTANQDAESTQVWKKSFDKFSTLLAQLGRPPEIPQHDTSVPRTYTHGASNQLYTEFMRRNSHRSIDAINAKNIFFEGGSSKAGRPVFYFIARNVSADSIDFELLIYHVLQVR